MDKDTAKKGMRKSLFGEGRISTRFRNWNIVFFALAFLVMIIAMFTAFYDVIRQVSTNYAEHYAVSSAELLSAHIVKEISLLAKAAHSNAVIDWMTDEGNNDKKMLAFEEMTGITRELYSYNLYIGLEKSLHEYKIEEGYLTTNIQPFAALNENNPDDEWYFKCTASDKDYVISVGIDRVLQRKRLWIDYKVVRNGILLGVICTGLNFSHVTRELFSHYSKDMRGLIIDADGNIHMDSSQMGKDDYLFYDFGTKVEDEFNDPAFLAAIKSQLDSIEGYFRAASIPSVIKLSRGSPRYATIAPIRFTNWSVVILYDSSSLLRMSLFLPTFATMLILLLAFAIFTSAISYRLIFLPLERLVGSLTRLKENRDERIYGIERNDEFGNLSNTIFDLFTKANQDALTGTYNRRFMENNLELIMEFLSRSNGMLSVLMLDVDFFKKYNDTYGHEQGDICLKKVAQALDNSVSRATDFVARYGGEEFIAVLPNTNEAGARVVAQNMLKNVRKLNLPHSNNAAAQYVTVSVGVTTGTVIHTQSWEDYSKRADEALYMSKQNGRNQYTYLDMTEAITGLDMTEAIL